MEKNFQLSMILFLAIAATAVSALIKDAKLDNLNAPIYFGDSNATVGEPFFITCVWKQPIKWHKDGKPIQEHFVRHSKEEFSYTQKDVMRDNGTTESTLSVNHALLNHGGNYKCNVDVLNTHSLKVFKRNGGDEDDHVEHREVFTPQPEEVTTILRDLKIFEDSNYEHTIYYDEMDSNEITTMTALTTSKTTKHHMSHMMQAVKSSTNNPLTSTIKISPSTMSPAKIDPTKHHTIESLTTPTARHHKNHENVTLKHLENKALVTHSTVAPKVDLKSQQIIQPKGKLTPVRDYEGHEETLFKLGKILKLQCKPDTKEEGAKIVWLKENEEVTKIANLAGHYEINKEKGIFSIPKTREEDAGNYTCQLGSEKHNFDVWARVVVKMPSNSYVVENEKLEIICIAKGTKAEIKWQFINDTTTDKNSEFMDIPESERFDFLPHDGIEDSKFVIKSAIMPDRGTYKCIGSNEVMDRLDEEDDVDDDGDVKHESQGTVRVKDKLAALWPFLGICAEVFVLCTIILIYEKRRNKTDLDESDTDSPDHRKK